MLQYHNLVGTSNETQEAFARDGFFIAKGLISSSIVNRCADELSAVFYDQLELLGIQIPNDIFWRAKALHDADILRYKKVVGSLWRLASVGDVVCHSDIRAFLKSVLGFGTIFVPGGQVVHIQAEELKIPDGYFGLAAHQDWPSVQGSLDGVVVWVPLCNIDNCSYPLEVVPGSHKLGLRPTENPDDRTPWTISGDPSLRFVPVIVEPGDVVFMSNFTVHRSGTTGKPNYMRVACSTRFDNGNERSFIERAYPSAYVRSVQRQLMDFSDVTEVNQFIKRMELPHDKN